VTAKEQKVKHICCL